MNDKIYSVYQENRWAIYKMIRKPVPPPTRVERPAKGRGYRRPQNKKELHSNE